MTSPIAAGGAAPGGSSPPLLSMRGITKRFGAVMANDGIDLTLRRGDILGLLGENGAGKTTLMNILFGAYAADAGSIEIDGAPVGITDSAVALAHGIGMVHQHFHLVGRHTVMENLLVGRPGRRGRLDRAGARARLAALADSYGLALDPDAIVGELSVGQQQRLEIVKALFWDARILILDEPTAVLTPQEAEALFAALRALAASGIGIIFISHKLGEVRAVTNRVLILRLGRVSASLDDTGSHSERQLAELMCGHAIVPPAKPQARPGRVLLRLAGLSTAKGHPPLRGIDMELRAGEILGIAGVSGNGQRALADVIAGVLEPSAGTIEVDGAAVTYPTPRRMQALGLGRIPEDRMGTGLVTTLPLAENMALTRIRQAPFSRFGLLNRRAIQSFCEAQIARFSIKTAGPMARTGTLSGGNLQKALLARELAWDPLVLLAAQPTRGLDIGAAQFVHRLFLERQAAGRAVLVISEDLEELFALCDRIAVMYEGRIVGTVPRAEASIPRIGLMMAGVAEDSAGAAA